MERIGFIGTGEIAAAMVAGLTGRGHQILVSERNGAMAAALAAQFSDVTIAPNDQVVADSDTVFLCLLADVARKVVPDLPFRDDHRVISVMVDVPLADLRMLCAPVNEIAITIPLPSIAVGGSALPVYPDSMALRSLFADTDMIIPCQSEVALNAHFAATALASPILDQMREGARWLAALTGDQTASEQYLATVFAGFLRSMTENPETSFTDLLDSLATEGGLNAAMRAHMREAGVVDALADGLDALKPRLGLTDQTPMLR
ncbi:pyrroline-5-carboxylate reductase [Aliiroseovarius sediminilitoris]|uniref:Pyrroline-5-carboxylate reductase n=1 Tax=Aliiroseovarius sediminilitoris TaxID=1173584 RepID=A0A1I0RAL4_9RHOB|nr:NAD(P)-binding domain-containing protein [Aliiroseovarius sediminilitoris]SEW37633.1 pyrroline-5-carboxylate reductase [Aliiroseovarius sediminilitoris]